MAYRVKIESFEGPFDLLLYLVSRQKVDVGTIAITEIADQYLAEIENMKKLDLDVASDFLLTAATLLKIKAESLLPDDSDEVDDDLAELAPSEARDMLVDKLVTYKTYKNAALALQSKAEAESRIHARTVGAGSEFADAMPDYLANVSLEKFAATAARMFARREIELLESEHIAAKPIPVEVYMESVRNTLSVKGKTRFSELVGESREPAIVVVTFLAILELHKQGMVKVRQKETFGDIDVELIADTAQSGLEE